LSSAILLAAIVAIWACALVPRWVRRGHESAQEPEAQEEFEYQDAYPEDSPPGTGEVYATEQAYTTDRVYAEQAYEVETDEAGITYHAETRYQVEITETAEVTEPSEPVAHPAASDHGRTRPAARPPAGQPVLSSPANPAPRAHALRARRRTLTTLLTLVIVAVGACVLGLADWWVIIPPTVMAGLYLLVLRAAVQAEAENATRRAAAHARVVARSRAAAAARAERAAAAERERAREAAEAEMAQPTAEVIDISALAAQSGDQIYDQYEDATARAIGD
jgi:hypothetical protein